MPPCGHFKQLENFIFNETAELPYTQYIWRTISLGNCDAIHNWWRFYFGKQDNIQCTLFIIHMINWRTLS